MPGLSVLEFDMQGRRFAVPLERVDEVVLRVLVTPLPGADAPVLGAIDYRGRIVAVFDLEARFGLPSRKPARDDHFIIARASDRRIALSVGHVLGTGVIPSGDIEASPVSGTHASGIARTDGGLLIIEDLDRVLTAEEKILLDGLNDRRHPGETGVPSSS